jgi:hypothetical protein
MKDSIQALNDLFYSLIKCQFQKDEGQVSKILAELDQIIKNLESLSNET